MLEAIDMIAAYTEGYTFEAFRRDRRTIDAVIRNLEVLGEAIRHVPPDVIARHRHIPWAEIRGMRNAVAHGYDVVRLDRVWDTTQNNLDQLASDLRLLLDQEPDELQ